MVSARSHPGGLRGRDRLGVGVLVREKREPGKEGGEDPEKEGERALQQ